MVGWRRPVERLNHLIVQDRPSALEVQSSFACFLHARSFKEQETGKVTHLEKQNSRIFCERVQSSNESERSGANVKTVSKTGERR